MRKTLALAVLVVLAAACGGDSPEGSGDSPEGSSDQTSSTVTTTVPDNTSTSVAITTEAPGDTPTTATAPTPTDDPSTTTPTDTPTTATTTPEPDTPTETTLETDASTTTTTTTTIPEPVLPPSPLTGLGVEDADLLNRRTMAVKVDNHWDARPQAGIGDAEMVVELLVEAGITRFIAFYHTVDSSSVGPVRSVRPTDPHLLRYFNATMLTSGGQDWIVRSFPRNGVGVIAEIGVGGYRDSTRSAPHNYFVNTAEMRPVADERLYPNTGPPPLFEFGDLPTAGILGAASRVDFEWAPTNKVSWRWNGSEWERHLEDGPHYWTPGNDEQKIVTADTLVVMFSRLSYTTPPGGGYSLPTMDTTGSGRALVFSQGQVVEGKWERTETNQPFALSLADGSPITVPPGRPWLSLFPEGRPVTW